ncbi:unnamed protein product [Ectocarpus sp. 6 AP-2014]
MKGNNKADEEAAPRPRGHRSSRLHGMPGYDLTSVRRQSHNNNRPTPGCTSVAIGPTKRSSLMGGGPAQLVHRQKAPTNKNRWNASRVESGASALDVGFCPLSRDTYFKGSDASSRVLDLEEPHFDILRLGRSQSAWRKTQAVGRDSTRSKECVSARYHELDPPGSGGGEGGRRWDGRPGNRSGHHRPQAWSRSSSPRQTHLIPRREGDGSRDEVTDSNQCYADGPRWFDAVVHPTSTALPSPSDLARPRQELTRRLAVEESLPLSGLPDNAAASAVASHGGSRVRSIHEAGNGTATSTADYGGRGEVHEHRPARATKAGRAGGCALQECLTRDVKADGLREGDNLRDIMEALARAEAQARREVEIAQNGADRERAARAVAEAALSKARESLKGTHEMLMESLDNGPKAALAALLEEKRAAEAKAAEAVATAEAAMAEAGRMRALRQARGQNSSLPEKERDQAQKDLVGKRSGGQEQTREFSAALVKARGDALTSRARAFALPQRLDQADVSGLQASLASLAAEKATAQTRTAELQAKLARVTSEHRRRAEASRQADAIAADRLSSAESRASAAEARLESVLRHLTRSERRLREAERAAVAGAERGKEAERNLEVEGVKLKDAGQQESATGGYRRRDPHANVVSAGHRSRTGRRRLSRCSEERFYSQTSDSTRVTAPDGVRHTAGCVRRVGEVPSSTDAGVRTARRRASNVGEKQRQRNDKEIGALQEKINASNNAPTEVFGVASSDDENTTTSSLREVKAARLRVVDAEREAAAFRADADRAKVEAARAAAEAEIGKERAEMECERFGRELRATEEQLRALQCALSSAQNGQMNDFPANGGSCINPKVSAIGGINEADMKARVVNKGDTKTFPPKHQGQQQEAVGQCRSGYAIEKDATTHQYVQATNCPSSGNQADTNIAVKNNNNSTQPDGQGVFNDGPAGYCPAEDGTCLLAKTDEQGRTWIADAEELLQQPQLHHAANVRLTEVPPPRTRAKVRAPNRDPVQEVAAAVTATGCRQVAEDRVRELEEVLSVSEKQHTLFRARAESRLEVLKLVFAQEQEEGGAQIALATLLDEKLRAERRANELESRLNDMIAQAAQAESDQLTMDIEEPPRTVNPGKSHLRGEKMPETAAELGSDAVDTTSESCLSAPLVRLKADHRPVHSAAKDRATVGIVPGLATSSAATGEEDIVRGELGITAPRSPVLRLTEAGERMTSSEHALQEARELSRIAMEESELLGRQLDGARAAERVEAEGRRLAQTKIADLERQLEGAAKEQERVRLRAESRLESLRAAFEQEEAEAGGKAALECLLGEKAELLARTAHLENRLHEAEAAVAKTAAAASALSEEDRTSVTWPAGGVHVDAGGRTNRCRSAEVAATPAAAGEAGQQQQAKALLLRTAGIAAKQSRDEADRLRHELKSARAEHAEVVASAAEEGARSARKLSTLQDAVEETKLEFQSHKDMAEARLEILKVAFDQEERENNAQAAIAVLLEEKVQAEQRAADACRAASESRSETARLRKQADEILHAREQEASTLNGNRTVAGMTGGTHSKVIPAVETRSWKVHAALESSENQSRGEQNTAGHNGSSCGGRVGTGNSMQEAVQEFNLADGEVEAVGNDRVRGQTEASMTRASEHATAVEAESQGTSRQLTRVAAAERTASRDTALGRIEKALRGARTDAERLRGELKRARAMETTTRAEAEGKNNESMRKIAQLEGSLRKAGAEHDRSRERAQVELGQLRATLERREREERAERAANGVSSAVETEEATVEAAGRSLENSRDELRVAEEAVAKATKEVAFLREELARSAETAARSKEGQETAETRVAELEGTLEGVAEEHVLFRKGVAERLETLRAAFEEENQQNGAQNVLTALLMEKEQIERRFAEDLNTAEILRSGLEHKLEVATDALGPAEARLISLEAELDAAKKAQVSEQQPTAGKAATAAGRHAGGDSGSDHDEASSSAAKEGSGQGRAADCSVADTPGSDPVSQDSVRGQERRPQKSETDAAPAETGEGRAELGHPQEAGTTAIAAATQDIESSDDRISVLETQVSKEGGRSQALPETPLDGAQRQAAERFAAQEATLHGAKQSLDQAREEVDTLRCQLAQALARERETAEAVEDERRVARQRIAELEDAIAVSKREGALLRERTEGRLEKLRLAAEAEEEENDSQAALAELLHQKSISDGFAAELTQAAVDARADFEQKLNSAHEALRLAEARAAGLKVDLEEAEARAAASAVAGQLPGAAAEGNAALVRHGTEGRPLATETVSVAAGAGETEAPLPRSSEDEVSFQETGRATPHSEEAITSATTGYSSPRQETEATAQDSDLKRRLEREVGRARASEATARDETAASRRRVSELEASMAASQRAHDSFRERTELRLRSLRLAVEDEELEGGGQAALECLLHEKTEDQTKVISLEARLLEARDAVDTTEAELQAVVSELKRVECLNSELLEAATPTPPAVALLDRQRLEARLEGLRVAVEEEDEENGVQASLAVLLEEKMKLEGRVVDLEQQLKEADEAVHRAKGDDAPTPPVTPRPPDAEADDGVPTPKPERVDAATQAAEPKAGAANAESAATTATATATATAAAVKRAANAEAALATALEEAEELEARCALAQARESEAKREANERVNELARELEEANDHGPQAALRALLEESAWRSSAVATASVAPEGDVHGKDDGDFDRVSLPAGSEDGENEEEGAYTGSGGGTVLGLLAQRDALLREKERLEKEAEDQLYVQHEQAYRRTINTGRYELTLDILEEDLGDAREQLAESDRLRNDDDGQQGLFKAICQRAKNAEDAKMRADEQLAETQEQLVIVCQALSCLGKDDIRIDLQSGEVEISSSSAEPSVASVQPREALSLVPTPPARCDEAIAAKTDGFPAQVAPPPTTTVVSVEETMEKRCGVGSSSTTTTASLRVPSVSGPGAAINAVVEPAETKAELAIGLDLEDGRVEHTSARGSDASLASIEPTVPASELCSDAKQSVGRSMQAEENPLGQPDVNREPVPAAKGMPKRGDSFSSARLLPLNAAADRSATPAADLRDAMNVNSGATGKASGTPEGLDETQRGIRAAVDESPQRGGKFSLSSAEVGFRSAVSVQNDDNDTPVVQSLKPVPADHGNRPAPEREDNARPFRSGLDTSPSSAGGLPSSSRRRRSSDSLFGLPRLTSMNTMRQERQEHQEKQNQELQQQHLLQEGKSNAQLPEHAIHATVGLRTKKTAESGRNRSLRDSPPPSGRVANGHARLGTQGERGEGTRQPPETGTPAAALVAGRRGEWPEWPDSPSSSRPSRGDATTSERRIGRLRDRSGSPSSSPESRGGAASCGKVKPERGRLLQRCQTPQGRSLSSPAAERGQSVMPGEEKQQPLGQPPRTYGGVTQSESASFSGGNCSKDASGDGIDNINATGTAAAAVRSQHQRGRSSGLVSPLRSGSSDKPISRKKRGGGSGCIRSESPEARG